jgi:hypothetical protein
MVVATLAWWCPAETRHGDVWRLKEQRARLLVNLQWVLGEV